jgi:hypothetical protein
MLWVHTVVRVSPPVQYKIVGDQIALGSSARLRVPGVRIDLPSSKPPYPSPCAPARPVPAPTQKKR